MKGELVVDRRKLEREEKKIEKKKERREKG